MQWYGCYKSKSFFVLFFYCSHGESVLKCDAFLIVGIYSYNGFYRLLTVIFYVFGRALASFMFLLKEKRKKHITDFFENKKMEYFKTKIYFIYFELSF